MTHATAFLHAPPNEQAGIRQAPQACRFAVLWLLGLPVVMEPLVCPVCSLGSEKEHTFGDHALYSKSFWVGKTVTISSSKYLDGNQLDI